MSVPRWFESRSRFTRTTFFRSLDYSAGLLFMEDLRVERVCTTQSRDMLGGFPHPDM